MWIYILKLQLQLGIVWCKSLIDSRDCEIDVAKKLAFLPFVV